MNVPSFSKTLVRPFRQFSPLHWLLFLIALMNLAFWSWGMWTVVGAPYSGMKISKDYRVLEIVPDSPAARAGMQVGDVLLSLNGESIATLKSPYNGLRWDNVGVYAVQRGDEVRYVPVVLTITPWRVLLKNLEPLLLAFIFLVVTMLVLVASPFTKATQLFFILGQMSAIMLISGGLSTFQVRALINNLFAISLLFLTPLVLHFYLTFPYERQGRWRTALLLLAYGGAIFFTTVYLLVDRGGMNATWLLFLASQRMVFTGLVMLIALISLFYASKQGKTIRLRRQHRLLIAGMLFSILPLLVFSFLPAILVGHPLIEYIWTFPFLILLPIAYAYAIHEENLGTFDYWLKETILYLTLVAFLFGIYYISYGIIRFLFVPSTSTHMVHIIAGIITIFVAVFGVEKIKERSENYLNRFFYGQWYDYRSIVQESSRRLSSAIHLNELARQLLKNIRDMRFREAALLWLQEDVLRLYLSIGYPQEVLQGFQIDPDSPLAHYLSKVKGPQPTLALFPPRVQKQLPPETKVFFQDGRVQIWVPLRTSRGELLGVLLIGRRQMDEPLDKEDWAILDTLAEQTSLAAENIHLVETLRHQLEVMARMQAELKEVKWRLTENSERERLELARLLHDGPIQDVYSIIYQLALWRKIHQYEQDPQLKAIEATLMNVEKSLRTFSTELRPPALESFGLEGAIRSHLSKLQEQHPHIKFMPDLERIAHPISARKHLALFRIYQEAINNAIRHAHPTRIWIRLFQEKGSLVLEIQDNGQGFNVPSGWIMFARQGHLGMLGISERVEALNGQLEVLSSPGQGTLIRVRVPLQEENPLTKYQAWINESQPVM